MRKKLQIRDLSSLAAQAFAALVSPPPWLFLVPSAALVLSLAACTKSEFPTYPEGYREFAYVANAAGNTVTVLDLVYLRPDRTLSVGIAPVALAKNPTRDEVYAVNSQPREGSGSVSVIDTVANNVVATIPVPRDPRFLVVDNAGARAYVVNSGANSVSVLDLAARKTILTVAAGDRPDMAALAPDGRTLVVTNQGSGTVTLYSVGSLAATPALQLRTTLGGCAGATSPVILPDSSQAFVACSRARQVLALSLASAPGTRVVKTDQALALLDVGANPTNLTLKPDGGELFVSNRDSDSISEVATRTDEVGSTYAIGNRPAHGVVLRDNSALWVSNVGAQAVSLYSIADGKFLSSLRTGLAPDALALSEDEHLLLVADTQSGDVAVIRTFGRLGPALFTILPAGGSPSAIVVKAMPPKP